MPLPDLTDDAKMARAGRLATLRYARHQHNLKLRHLCAELANRNEDDQRPFDRLDQIVKHASDIVEIEAALRSL